MAKEVIFDSVQLQEILPHRYPFLLIDKVVEFIDGQRVVGIKNVTMNEPFFQGHFPGRPVMPGVLIFEAMAQTAAVMAKKSDGGMCCDQYVFLVGANDFKWKRQVVPGDTLVIEVDFVKRRKPLWIVNAKATVDGEVVASGSITAAEAE